MIESDKLFDENLKHVGYGLKQAHGTNAVGTLTALEECAHAALEIDIEECEQCVSQKEQHADEHTLNGHCRPGGAE
jgi:hypothetical protein